jgi:hypothetical protein
VGWPTGPVGVVGMRRRVTGDDARAWVERTCDAQGLPVKVTDRATISAVVVLLGQSRQTGLTRSGSKRVRPRVAGRTTARSKTADTIAR